MNCYLYWLISSCSSFFCFRFSLLLHSFYLCLCCIFLVIVVLLRLCFLLYALNSSHNISPYLCSVLSFLASYFYCSDDAVCIFLCVFQYSLFFWLLKVMLSCGIAIFLSSPTNNTFAKTVLIIFIIFTFFLFGLLSVLAWVFFNKNYFTVFNIELIKRFHRERMAFLGICIV